MKINYFFFDFVVLNFYIYIIKIFFLLSSLILFLCHHCWKPQPIRKRGHSFRTVGRTRCWKRCTQVCHSSVFHSSGISFTMPP
jgi:hypothetical protein